MISPALQVLTFGYGGASYLGPTLQVLVLCDECREYQRMMVEDLYLAPVIHSVAA